jgi:predicted O-methyltransferase YrrM
MPETLDSRAILELAVAAVDEQEAQQKAAELAALGLYLTTPEIARPTGLPNELRRIVEIGSYKGGTAWYWRRLAPEATIVCVDREIVCPACRVRAAHRNCPRRRVTENADVLIEADSASPETVRRVAGYAGLGSLYNTSSSANGSGLFPEGAGIDLLFIDGDHSARGVESDFNNYAAMLSGKGVVVLHDVAGPTPAQIGDGQLTDAVQQFWHNMKLLVPQAFEIIEPEGGPWGGLGVIPKPA